ncbi:UNVERIFIED_CONTAM: hypothetical protein FKN15_067759 [Acipenser sinensis]
MPVVAGVVFTLTAHLSQSVRTEQQQGCVQRGSPPQDLPPSPTLRCTSSSGNCWTSSFVLGGGFQRLRAHLCGALLYYLQVAQKPDEPETLETDRIVSIDKQCHWLLYMSNSGYLRALVESLRQENLALQRLLRAQPPLLKALYIYESKMALLTLVAKNPQGAAELLRCGLIVQVVQCEVYDMRPETLTGRRSAAYIIIYVFVTA